MTKDDIDTAKTFASLRFVGERLDPDRVTAILGTAPTTAYRKGEVYKESRGREARGRTGVWLLSSKGAVNSSDLKDHLEYLRQVLYPADSHERVERLKALLCEMRAEADIGCFWHGHPPAPSIPTEFKNAFAELPATIEVDVV